MDVFICLSILLLTTSVIGKPASSNVSNETRVAREFNNTSTFTNIVPTRDISIRDAIYITPKLMFVGKSNGDILRCLYKDPSVCEMYYSYGTNIAVTAIVINGEYLYASLLNGVMLRCSLYEKNSCSTFTSVTSQMSALVISNGYILAGLQDGRMLRCELHQSDTCSHINSFNSAITSLAVAEDKHIYVGLSSKEIWRCSISSENSCRLFNTGTGFSSQIKGLVVIHDTVIGITQGGTLWTCTRDLDCTSRPVPGSAYTNAVVFNGSLYTVQSSTIWACDWITYNCSAYDTPKEAVSIAFAYRTYKMQERFSNEGKTCLSESRCPPFMTYYKINERPIFEVFVKHGRLYNSQGVLVDTRGADVARSGRAAIFAMGADGQILLSNVHHSHLRTSSLFAGNPVASAGEMVVKDGFIESIRSCSDHYQSDVELNQQIMKVLFFKGFRNWIESLPCCEGCRQGNVDYDQ